MKQKNKIIALAVVAGVAVWYLGTLNGSPKTAQMDSRTVSESVDGIADRIVQNESLESDAVEGNLYAQIITAGEQSSIYTDFTYEY